MIIASIELLFCDEYEGDDRLECVIDNTFLQISPGHDSLHNTAVIGSLPILSRSPSIKSSVFGVIDRGQSEIVVPILESSIQIQGYTTFQLSSSTIESMIYSQPGGDYLTFNASYLMWLSPFGYDLLSHPLYTSAGLLPKIDDINDIEKISGKDSDGNELSFTSLVIGPIYNGVRKGSVVVRIDRQIPGSSSYGKIQTEISWITSVGGAVFILSLSQKDVNTVLEGFSLPPKCDSGYPQVYNNSYTLVSNPFETGIPCYQEAMFAQFGHLNDVEQSSLGVITVDSDGSLPGLPSSQQSLFPLQKGVKLINEPVFIVPPNVLEESPMFVSEEDISITSVGDISGFFSSAFPLDDESPIYSDQFSHSLGLLALMSSPFLNYSFRVGKALKYSVFESFFCISGSLCSGFPNGPYSFEFDYRTREWYQGTILQATHASLTSGSPVLSENYVLSEVEDYDLFLFPPFITFPAEIVVIPITIPIVVSGIAIGVALVSVIEDSISDMLYHTSCNSNDESSYCLLMNMQGDLVFSNGKRIQESITQFGHGAIDDISIISIDPLVSLFLMEADVISIRSSLDRQSTIISVNTGALSESFSTSVDGEEITISYLSGNIPEECLTSSTDSKIVCSYWPKTNFIICEIEGNDSDFVELGTCVIPSTANQGIESTYESISSLTFSLDSVSHLWDEADIFVDANRYICANGDFTISDVSTNHETFLVLMIIFIFIFISCSQFVACVLC
ncbi:hypothetical protein ADUPG1_010197 [Aduncisulcus paluster]|uniref:Uncharacterized protein n=1 Tax=Aduncisulcus paluster TaxID=2918883 RepID=A0ABQ5JRS1_9EUKA|nr:hypothetical protein ADUPG1_010197 [Aduncisulcus paluster]